jgi:hypothetical protein
MSNGVGGHRVHRLARVRGDAGKDRAVFHDGTGGGLGGMRGSMMPDGLLAVHLRDALLDVFLAAHS